MKTGRPPEFKMPANSIALLFGIINLILGCAAPAGYTASKANPEMLFALSAEAELAYRESRWLDAARGYQLLSELVPEDPYAWFRLGNVYARQGLFDEATIAYLASIKRDSVPPKPWYNLATTHLLNAQHALRQSNARLRHGDPARKLIEQQLTALNAVIYQRVVGLAKPGHGFSR